MYDCSRFYQGEMMADSWFKGDVIYDCPFCRKRSCETVLAAADSHNPRAVAEKIQQAVRPLTCQNCRKQAPQGVKVDIGMNNLTPEELAELTSGDSDTKPM